MGGGAQVYYLAGAYVYLTGAGAVAVDGWLFARRRRPRILGAATAVVTAFLLPALLPVLPVDVIGSRYPSKDMRETVGWPELVGTVGGVWRALPPAQRAGHVRVAATITNGPGVHNIEYGGHVYVCTDPRERWAAAWPRLRHYG